MKREFLQNLKVGDQALPKEVIDAIMAENGRDIEEAKKPFADYETIKTQLGEAKKTIKGFEDQDIDGVRQSAKDWEEKYNKAIADHKKELADRDFDSTVEKAISAAKGRNAKHNAQILCKNRSTANAGRNREIRKSLSTLSGGETCKNVFARFLQFCKERAVFGLPVLFI